MTRPLHGSRTRLLPGNVLVCAYCGVHIRHIGGACGEATPEVEAVEARIALGRVA